MMVKIASYGQSYQYPVTPGTEEWKALNSTIEKIEICQIPETVLKNISTENLLLTCLNYPLLNNYTASNSPYEGLLNIINIFNGLNEFINRIDAPKILADYYAYSKVSDIEAENYKGNYTFIFSAVELLLSHEKIINRFNEDEKREVLKTIMLKYKEKETYSDYFGFYGKMTTAFVASKYIEKLSGDSLARNDIQRTFTDRMLMIDLNVVDELLIMINEYTNKLN